MRSHPGRQVQEVPCQRQGRRSALAPRAGDLIHLDGLPASLRPPVEHARITRVTPPAAVPGDLLGEGGARPIVVVGTSFTRTSNFVSFLAHALGDPVVSEARDGAAFAGSAAPYFADRSFGDDPPRVVVWEVPERVLEAPVTDEERAWWTAVAGPSAPALSRD